MTATTDLGQPPIDNATQNDDDLIMWGVTTLIGAMDKPALLYWAAEQTALAAIHNDATWRGMLSDDDPTCHHDDATGCQTVKWLRDARFRRPKGIKSATELGTLVHDACEQYALTGSRPTDVDDEVAPFLDSFDRWLQQFQPTYQATEVCVYSPQFGYAGTCDGFLTIDGVRFIIDYKSTRRSVDGRGHPTRPYPEQVALQLAAYRHADYAAVWRPRRLERMRRRYYLLSPQERQLAQPVPEVDAGLVIHITPETCDAYPIDCGHHVWEAFLAIQDTARWLYQTSRNVMADPLQPTRSTTP